MKKFKEKANAAWKQAEPKAQWALCAAAGTLVGLLIGLSI